ACWIEFAGRPAVLGSAFDLTDRKRAEQTLRESQERFRQVVEHIREVFWMTDVDKNQILYVSQGYEEIWGRTCASLYASPWDCTMLRRSCAMPPNGSRASLPRRRCRIDSSPKRLTAPDPAIELRPIASDYRLSIADCQLPGR